MKPDGEVCLLVVAPTMQGKGIGTLLLKELSKIEKVQLVFDILSEEGIALWGQQNPFLYDDGVSGMVKENRVLHGFCLALSY